MTEQEIQNTIMAELSGEARLFRTNAGTMWQGDISRLPNGETILRHLRRVQGLPKGHSDLAGVRIGDGRAVYIEVKTPTGKVRPDQENFLRRMREYGALAGVARSVEDARRIIHDDD